MGIPGILKEIGKGERVALSKLATDHLQRHNRPLRIAIDAAIWSFQTQSGQGGKNPALRTLFFRLLRLLALPIQPVFVYDGKDKPLSKRGRTVTRYHGSCLPNELSKVLIRKFAYPCHDAPGEAEAECALLQRRGVVDAVMSQDADAIMFGAGVTFRDWSKEGKTGNKGPTHVTVMDVVRLKEVSGLDPDGMILVALLSGGDYDPIGVPGFGPTLACDIARAGFGTDLMAMARNGDWSGLAEWRQRLQYELEVNESGYFKKKHRTLKVPETFPDFTTLGYYINPAVSSHAELTALLSRWNDVWESQIDVAALRKYTDDMFDWAWRSGARRFVRCFAQPLLQDRLRRGTVNAAAFSANSITESRRHFINDGIPELRLSAVPVDVVGIDIEAEPDNPEYAMENKSEDDEMPTADLEVVQAEDSLSQSSQPFSSSQSTKARSAPWSPYEVEKWWIPEILLELGLPEVIEGWHQLQRDIRSDPCKFATRKLTKTKKITKNIDTGMKSGAIRGFFTAVNKGQQSEPTNGPSQRQGASKACISSGYEIQMSNTTKSLISSSLTSHPSPRHFAQREISEVDSKTDHSKADPKLNKKSLDSVAEIKHGFQANQISSEEVTNAVALQSSPATNRFLCTLESSVSPKSTSQVTQRKPKKARSQSDKTASSPASPTGRVRRPIESFFTGDRTNRSNLLSIEPCQHLLPAEPSTGLLRNARGTAVTRDSLPGTWTEAKSDSFSERRPPRVSYIDLTGD